ncbi:hypothetical protein [Streptomyces boncukensis]|uniref:Secreted protein n=1 Tax=Streptomyces boncukensis TaxID=2711219 RepID=A0A6G4X059_9ACTN|nr:hypothetical protein [Streptomyces boncukensis]NGO70875.1 hypothetical protein [Streptomyces boncukensis]
MTTFRVRAAVAGLVTAGLLGAGAATTSAVAASKPEPKPKPKPVAKTNTVTADHKAVHPWQQFRLHGKVTGIKAGTAVHLEEKQHGKWKRLPARSAVNRSHGYEMRVKLGQKGKQEVRTVAAGKPSNPVTVTVR